ncbi:YczE/YyaS/YitT family protein [Mycolicibacterium hodleri]|uniref:membrane protein YczE n=1 Tax=Mycolicibacterium hodleri TaxID=49897 RepID=UPI001F3A7931|nr:hypothetical protein [Mycolicibacterium hodleri]
MPRPFQALSLVVGLWLFGSGEAMLVEAEFGNSPWTVFAQGIATHTPLSIGVMVNIISALVLLLWIPLRQRPGLGTVASVPLVGISLDVSLWLIPPAGSLLARVGLCLAGILVVALGSGLYLRCGLGPGPRDGLMTGIARVSGWPLGASRALIEVIVLAVGWMLGGVAGVGTLLFAGLIGPCVNIFVRWQGSAPADHL